MIAISNVTVHLFMLQEVFFYEDYFFHFVVFSLFHSQASNIYDLCVLLMKIFDKIHLYFPLIENMFFGYSYHRMFEYMFFCSKRKIIVYF